MKLSEYQELASRTMPDGTRNELLTNFALGIAGEGGELVDLIKKIVFHNHPLDETTEEKIIGELGDCLWYLSQTAEVLDISLDAVAYLNIKKLKTRYPDGFSSVSSQKRVDVND